MDQMPKHDDPSSEHFTGKEDSDGKPDAESSDTLTVPSAGEVSDHDRLKSITTMNVMSSGPIVETEPVLVPDTIAIHLPGREDPLVFRNTYEITLGRSGASSLSLPDVDLSIDHGVLLGVSRQHAVIRRTDEGYFIEDLGSTNGTWVNGKAMLPYKPYPLHNGDQVGLAEQILFVYFSFGDREVVHTLLLKDRSLADLDQTQTTLSVPYLLEKAGTYLRALANVQHILDEAQVRPFTVGVDQVGRHKNGQWVEIVIRGAGQAIEAIRTSISELPPAPNAESGEFPQAYWSVAQGIIRSVAPSLAGDRLHQLTGELLPHMASIIDSDFEVVSSRLRHG